jgi:thymidine kinase
MNYGTLTVYCGPMFAGKTTSILKSILWAKNGEGRNVLVLKPAFDNRYAETEIVSHTGLRTTAHSITALPESVDEDVQMIVLDEVQFFLPPYVDGDCAEWVRHQLESGRDVVVGGLDLDWQGKPFEVTAKLAAMADYIEKITSDCTVCGRPASKTFKKHADESVIELGASDLYEARCNQHWRS